MAVVADDSVSPNSGATGIPEGKGTAGREADVKSFLRVIPTLMLLVVGGTSFLLSYVAIRDVSAELGAVPQELAWAVPVCIDGGILAASAAIWGNSYQKKKRDPWAFLTVLTLLTTSVIINVYHAGESHLAQWIAALPPIILLACLELVAAGQRAHVEAEPNPDATQEQEVASAASDWATKEPEPATPTQPYPVPPLESSVSEGEAQETNQPEVTEETPSDIEAVAEPENRPEATESSSAPDRAPAEHRGNQAPQRQKVAATPEPTDSHPAEPSDGENEAEAAPAAPPTPLKPSKSPGSSDKADRIVKEYHRLLGTGMTPQDRNLVSAIADATSTSPTYVRRTIMPLKTAIAPPAQMVDA